MAKVYVSTKTKRTPLARNKRLRMEGASGGSTSGSSVVTIGGSSESASAGHTHANLSDLNKLTVDDGYVVVQQTIDDEPAEEKVKAGWADTSGHADEADEAGHAAEADEATHAAKSDNATNWDGHSWSDWLDQPVRSVDAVRFESLTTNDVKSVRTFVDGLAGSGYRIWTDNDGVTHMSVDKLTVRQTMTVLELLVEKMRSVGGTLAVSAANGKVASVTETDSYYRLTFEGENTFVQGDLMRCSTMSGTQLKSYWVEVIDVVDGDTVVVEKSAFGDAVPEEGDECVLMGNTKTSARQNLIMISATEDGQPRIDVLNGVKTTSTEGCLRARLGNLDGIQDEWFGDDQPQGDGLYSDNVFLKGKFLLETGDDVKTRFEVTEGLIESVADGIRQDFVNDKGYLSNAAFTSGMDKWETENEAVFYTAGGKWIWANSNVLTHQLSSAKVVTDSNRKVLRIRNKWITQKNEHLLSKPEMTELASGSKEAVPVYLSFFYRCSEAGTLTVGFEDVDKDGFEEFDSLHIEENIDVTSGYEQWTGSGMWNGTGDFKVSFTGEIYLYMLILTTDRIEALSYRYRTLFEQTENLVRICAAVYAKDETALRETGLFVKPEGSGLYAQDAEGNVACIGVSVDETDDEGNHHSRVKLTAENIQLEGLVTANENFKILSDGSIEAKSGTFDGFIRTSLVDMESDDAAGETYDPDESFTLKVGSSFNLLSDSAAYRQVKLPNDSSYIGARVLLVSSNFSPYTLRTVDNGVGVYCESGGIYNYPGDNTAEPTTSKNTNASGLYFIGGNIELLGIKPIDGESDCNWMLLNYNVSFMTKADLTYKP